MIGLTLTSLFSPPQVYYGDQKKLPKMEYIMDPYVFTPGKTVDEDERNYFLNWYWVHYLKAAAGASEYIDDHKFYKLPVQAVEGSEKGAAVTKESEAFALLVCLNCYKKWQHYIPAKHADPKFDPPAFNKEDSSTHKWYTTEWTHSTNGQVKGEGWAPAAYTRLTELIKQVKAFRKSDKTNGWVRLQAALAYVQATNNIDVGATGPAKKKKKKNTGAAKPVYLPVEVMSDDDFD